MMHIKVLGPGCQRCKALDKLTREVVEAIGVDATVSKVEEILEIMKYGILSTPAIVINEEVVLKGYVPEFSELREIILKHVNNDLPNK